MPDSPAEEDDFLECYVDDAVSCFDRVHSVYRSSSSNHDTSLQGSCCKAVGLAQPSTDYSDGYLSCHSRLVLNQCKRTLVPRFRALLGKSTLSSSPGGVLRAAAYGKNLQSLKGNPSGVDFDSIPGLLTEDVSPTTICDYVAFEGELTRCVVEATSSVDRLALVTLWCFVAVQFGLEQQGRTLLYKCHEVGLAMADIRCTGTDDFERYYFAMANYTRALEDKWNSVMRTFFRSRREISFMARDMLLCNFHPPYTCGTDHVTEKPPINELFNLTLKDKKEMCTDEYVEGAGKAICAMSLAVNHIQGCLESNRGAMREAGFGHEGELPEHFRLAAQPTDKSKCFCEIEQRPCKFGSENGDVF